MQLSKTPDEFLPHSPVEALSRQRIEGRLVREVEEMIVFAMASGIGVPPQVGTVLSHAFPDGNFDQSPTDWIGRPSRDEATAAGPETGADAAVGDQIPPVPQRPNHLALLAMMHLELSRLIAPAKPGTAVSLIVRGQAIVTVAVTR